MSSHLWNLVCVCALLATVGVCEESPQPLNVVHPEIGSKVLLRVRTDFHTVEECNLITPQLDIIKFLPEDQSDDRFRFQEAPLFGCQAVIENINEKDAGIWQLVFRSDDGVTRSESYNVLFGDEGNQDLEPELVTTTESDVLTTTEVPIETTWLNWLYFGSAAGTSTSITLSRTDVAEECFLTREGRTVRIEDVDIDGVQVYPTSTHFVSCRVVIGPMTQDLLGEWTLCGRREVNGRLVQRCQPTITSWDRQWNLRPQLAGFDHPVNFGGSVNPTVNERGSTLNTCHVVTPFGEDIVLNGRTDYPGLVMVTVRDQSFCSVNITGINRDFLGSWEIYATYNNSNLFNVVRRPLTFFLYDEKNPYDQAYNVTNLNRQFNIVNMGNIIEVNVTGSNTRVECLIVTNRGEMFNNNSVNGLESVSFVSSNNAVCRFRIGPITEDLLGEWLIRGRFRRNAQNNNEIILPFTIKEEDPENPFVDDTFTVENLEGQDIYTTFGTTHDITSDTGRYQTTLSCHLRTPAGLQFILGQGFSHPGVTLVTGSNIACGIRIHVDDENTLGDWVLISRVTLRGGARIERRSPFTIHVEDYVQALPNATVIAEGNDLFLRLENAASNPSSCGLEGPSRSTGDVDQNFAEYCGFIVRQVTEADNGQWNITYGNRIKIKAFVQVTVTPRSRSVEQRLSWTKDKMINLTIGPEDTTFCSIENPRGLTVFEGFGRCNIILHRVTAHDEGTWKMTIATEGRVLTETFEFIVDIAEPEPKAEVITSVLSEKPYVMLSCHVPVEEPVTACKFRDPTGRVLLVSRGVGEGRYTFHGVSSESNDGDHQCGLRITDPVVSDLGLWRCAIETEVHTYYGFLTVLGPFAMQRPEVAAQVVTEPTLTATSNAVTAVEGDDVIMRCSINSAIRYCYFRRENGTVFSVSPDSTDGLEYVGAGLDAGDCGVRFPSLQAMDGGRWSCHVGFRNSSLPEQRADFNVTIEPLMTAEALTMSSSNRNLIVRVRVHSHRALEYCRFVRMDGLGFTDDNVPAGYRSYSDLNVGRCEIHVDNPSILELHPWTVAVRILGQSVEVSRTTDHTLELPIPTPMSSNFLIVWILVLVVSLLVFFVGTMLGPKKNRQATYRRATAMRDSIRRSFRKEPLPA